MESIKLPTVLFGTLLFAGCGSGGAGPAGANSDDSLALSPLPGFITRDDVINLPIGDAVGTEFDGRVYQFVSATSQSCQCTQETLDQGLGDPCDSPSQILWDESVFLRFSQTDGELTIIQVRYDASIGDFAPAPIEGPAIIPTTEAAPIFADDTFVLGAVVSGITDPFAGHIIGEALVLIEGSFEEQILTLQYTQREQSTANGVTLDCQQQITATMAQLDLDAIGGEGFVTIDDITNLPPGDATGSEYDGRFYQQVSLLTESCECSPDSVSVDTPCEAFQILDESGLVLEIVQDGGEIQFRTLEVDPVSNELVDIPPEDRLGFAAAPGSLNQDGTFIIGGIGELILETGERTGQVISLLEGQFTGDVIILNLTDRATVTQGDLKNDCQIISTRTFVRIEPGAVGEDDGGVNDSDVDGCGELLAGPLDGVIVLSDLSVWDVFSGDEFTVSTWLAGDCVTVSEIFGTSTLTNARTSEAVSAFFDGIGVHLTIVGFQDQEFEHRLISFDDGTTWEIFFSDENESQTWQVGDEVVLFQPFSIEKAINLRTGRVISLF